MNSELNLLVVDDEADFADGLARVVGNRYPELTCSAVTGAEQALSLLKSETVPVILADLRMPDMDGLDLLGEALEAQPDIGVILITAYGSIERAVEALKAGAYDLITKPVDHEKLFSLIDKVLERYRLLTENRRLRRKAGECEETELIIGESPAVMQLKKTLATVAQNDYTVLIQGESGTGKELAARVIHNLSPRSDRKMVTVNCPAIPDHLLESELFGHKKGAFTGATQDHEGVFAAADKGTILLDEISNITPAVQTKMLRVLQEHEIRAVGSSTSRIVDVRIIATTNQDLSEMVCSGTFREDLYYRLNVLNIQMPPLKERTEDIPILVYSFVRSVCREMNIESKTVDPEVLSYLSTREWPGNVRELLNFVRRLVVFCPGNNIGPAELRFVDQGISGSEAENDGVTPYKQAKSKVVDDFTHTYVRDILGRTNGNISRAARLSGLERVSLQKIMRRLDIEAEPFRKE
mgnify:CR=1 FL=1